MKLTHGHRWLMMLLAATLLASCADDDAGSEDIIRLRADVWQVMEGTRAQAPARSLSRATTYGNASDLQTEGSFTCTVYQENTTTEYIPATTVNWSDPEWLFNDGKHYWPAAGALDFFAYMPATTPAYINNLSYAVSGTPAQLGISFNCDMTQTIDKEFIYALTTGQNKTANSSGVALTFKHPFARVTFVLSPASGEHVVINRVELPDIYKTGTHTFDGSTASWSGLGGASTFTATIGTPTLVIPYNYGSKTLTVNATWDDWSSKTKNISANVPINWEAGHSYTYTLTVSQSALVVDTDTYTEQW